MFYIIIIVFLLISCEYLLELLILLIPTLGNFFPAAAQSLVFSSEVITW